jgi:hypothetical protein
MIILQDVPDELKGKDDTKGEASLKGHLKNGEDEKTGSQAYVPPDEKKDKQLTAAIELLHGKAKAQIMADLQTKEPVKEAKDAKDAKDVKEAKDTKDVKDSKEAKDSKDAKDAGKDAKDPTKPAQKAN